MGTDVMPDRQVVVGDSFACALVDYDSRSVLSRVLIQLIIAGGADMEGGGAADG